jgi:hypothetical protein
MIPHWIGTLLRINESGAFLYDSLDAKNKLAELREGDLGIVIDFDAHHLRGIYYNILTANGMGWTHSAWLNKVG